MIELTKISWKERLVLLGALAVFVLSATLLGLFDYLFARPVISPEDVIGSVVRTRGRVERKTPDTFSFDPIFMRDPIGNGDTIYSSKTSGASLKLIDESVIRIGPESLIVIREYDGQFNIRVDKGAISGELNPDSKIEIQTEEESVFLNGEVQQEFSLRYKPRKGLYVDQAVQTALVDGGQAGNSAKDKTPEKTKDQAFSEPNRVPAAKSVKDTILEVQTSVPESSKEPLMPVRRRNVVKQFDSQIKLKNSHKRLKAPYPKNGQVVLFKKAQILQFLPAAKCQTNCQVFLYKDKTLVFDQTFKQDRTPVLSLSIGRLGEGRIQWKVVDGNVKSTGFFEIYPYTDQSLGQALKNKQNIEVLE